MSDDKSYRVAILLSFQHAAADEVLESCYTICRTTG